jgi:hypothetical protein
MTNLFKISVRKVDNEGDEQHRKRFESAFNDIFKLTKMLCDSDNETLQNFVQCYIEDDPPWLSYETNKIFVVAEAKTVRITLKDVDNSGEIEYDFGKRSPAEDLFILSVIAIFKHHLPNSEIFDEVDPYEDEFDDVVRFVSLVNPTVKNPYTGMVPTGPVKSPDILGLMVGLGYVL